MKPVLSSGSVSASPGVACDCGNNFVGVVSKSLAGKLIASIWRTHFRSALSWKQIKGSWQWRCQVGDFEKVRSICCITCIGYFCDDTSGCSRSTCRSSLTTGSRVHGCTCSAFRRDILLAAKVSRNRIPRSIGCSDDSLRACFRHGRQEMKHTKTSLTKRIHVLDDGYRTL